ncbi:allantoinase [Rhodococcus sp. Leaf7]|uniref:allantoinase AllB n=1 Tax=unclassified Rhodococcus (in: high G+C Gram-positive bacteria) TaxID=192944 RepID=UPI0006FAA136|nr:MULTISPECIES: allantoinase AllB [unclassified Rhodococcus (in: high G+C Gram-positive bacteria)]KQU02498.1 allantoinase [Rhodococcus sp. Leaf7]KQU37969.1 allantoinase [Rhodococcus sp. Leaf247]
MDVVFRAPRAIVTGPDGRQVETSCAVGVVDGRIAVIGGIDDVIDATTVVDLADDEVLLPGLVDTHVHVNEPGRTEWEGFASATAAAAAGGVTTVIDMPLNSIPSTVSTEALAVKRDVAGPQARVNVGFWGGAVPGNVGDLRPMHDAGVFGFKCFLLHSGVDEFPPLSPVELEAAMVEIASFDGLLIVHAEDSRIIAESENDGGREYADFLASRPRAAENTAIADVIAASTRTGCRVHILHLSSAEAVPLVAEAKRAGVRITAETCPHYLSFAAEEISDGATQFKCCPPIREAGNRDALWQALSDGVIDTVVTDHSPCTAELKRFDIGDFGAAWGGIASLQVSLSAVWSEARRRGHGLTDVVTWMAVATSAQVGLASKGSVEVGRDADLIVFAPDQDFVVHAAELRHKNPVTAYDDRRLSGVVRSTWLAGVRVDLDGDPQGVLLDRE